MSREKAGDINQAADELLVTSYRLPAGDGADCIGICIVVATGQKLSPNYRRQIMRSPSSGSWVLSQVALWIDRAHDQHQPPLP